MQARVWSIKAGKISKNRNKQTSVQEHEKTDTVPERKEIRAVCVLTPRSFSHIFNIKFKVRSLKRVIFFFVLLMRIYFQLS